MNFLKISAGALLFTAVAFPAVADDKISDKKDKNLKLEWIPVPVLKSGDGKFQIKLRGRALLDHAWVNDDDNSINLNATEFRSARLGIDSQYGKRFSFRFVVDFARKRVTYRDIYIQYKGAVTFRVGHIKWATPMENTSSLRFIPFMERSGFANAFGFGRQFGALITKSVGNGMIQVGIGQGGFATKGSISTGFKFAARVTQALPIEGGNIHLGTSFTYMEPGDDQGKFFYRARPLQHLAPRFLNTNQIADSQTFFGLEAGVFKGPFNLVGELGFLKADLVTPMQGQSDPTFWGGHVTVGYFLTGEDSPYNPKNGTYIRPKVKNPVFKGGSGAIQVIARYDYLDLVDNGIFGGIKKTFVVGINWWMGKNVKMVFNYSHSDISQAFLVAINGADGANKINAFGVRTQIDW
ncbi:MAG: porin [Sphingomonadales bacterium]